jgi:hypothetical protein
MEVNKVPAPLKESKFSSVAIALVSLESNVHTYYISKIVEWTTPESWAMVGGED